jgi:pimeloyl-ACP methyl ester carboxylesterase
MEEHMPFIKVRGVELYHEVHGERGPWVSITPGGRNPGGNLRPLAQKLAQAGCRVLLHDRRNCGASDVSIDGPESEYDMWADDLHALLAQLGARPAIVGGSSSGCRMSVLFTLRHPGAARALLLWRVTGGHHAVRMLREQYYDLYVRAAEKGGMAAVCEVENFKAAIDAKPSNRDKLLAMDPNEFVRAMQRWSGYFERGKDQPIIGASEDDLRSIKIPTCIIAGNDQRHPRRAAQAAHRLMPNSEYHDFLPEEDVDMVSPEVWLGKADDLAKILVRFLDHALVKA